MLVYYQDRTMLLDHDEIEQMMLGIWRPIMVVENVVKVEACFERLGAEITKMNADSL